MWHYSNTSVPTTLLNDIDATATSIQIGDTSGLPVQYPYTLVLDFEGTAMEVVTVTSAAGASLIIQRGQDGTSAQPHVAGAVVVHAAVARDLQEPQDHIASDQNVHGVGPGSFVVGTNTVQILAGKTIDGNFNTLLNIPAGEVEGTFQNIVVTGSTPASVPFRVNASLLQSGNLTEWRNQNGILIADVSAPGVMELRPLIATDHALRTFVGADIDPRFVLRGSGSLEWGDGTTRDTNLFRASPNLLKTDDSFEVVSTLTVGGPINVTGVATFGTGSFTQATAGTPGLTVNAHATPTSPAVRIVGDESFAGLEVRRNSATTTGDMMRFATEGGVTMAQYQRNGALVVPQVTTGATALTVSGIASATTPPVIFTGDPSQPALRVRRNAATSLTADLQVWASDTNAVLSRVKRGGEMAAPDLLLNNDSNRSLAFALIFTDIQALQADTGWSLDRAELRVWMERICFLTAQFTRTGAAISSPSTGPGITDVVMGSLALGVTQYAPASVYVRGECAPNAQFPGVFRLETDGRLILEAFSAPSLTIATGGGVPLNVMWML